MSTSVKAPKGQSKLALVVGQAYALAVGLVHWFPAMNAARDVQPHLKAGRKSATGDVKGGVFESLIERGWSSELPAQGILLPYTLLSGITADAAIKQRQTIIDELDKADDTALASICRDVWFPKGKAVVPIVCGNSGFTRGLSLPDVLLAKARQAIETGKEFDPSEYTVQIVVKEFANETDRIVEQSFENVSRRMTGTTDMTWPDYIKAGQALLRAAGKHGNERTLRRAFGDGNGMKAFAILTANNRFPSLHLVDRIKMARPENFDRSPESYVEGGYVPAASIPQNAKDLREAKDEKEAELFLKTKVFGGSNTPKTMTRPQWEAAATTYSIEAGSPLDAVRKAHLDGLGLGDVVEKYPQLCKANCVLTLAEAKATSAKAASGSGIGKRKKAHA